MEFGSWFFCIACTKCRLVMCIDIINTVPHCHCPAVHSQTSVGGVRLNLPDVCSNSPVHGKAFCTGHCELLQEEAPEFPTGLR